LNRIADRARVETAPTGRSASRDDRNKRMIRQDRQTRLSENNHAAIRSTANAER
jgi:hypothetical protein